jgi:hypothetical protein
MDQKKPMCGIQFDFGGQRLIHIKNITKYFI